MGDFQLSAQLAAHESDVRDLAFPTPDLVLSASRDHTVRSWKRISTSPPGYEATIANQIHAYINALAYIPPSAESPQGLIVSGGKDPCLDVRKVDAVLSDNAERILPGHANNVCSLAAFPSGEYFVSGSWDHTARVWSVTKWDSVATLTGHEGAVWDVLPIDDSTVATGCADKIIRIFQLSRASGGSAEAASTIHTPDVVRGLCKVPPGHASGADIASSHNDGVIRLWKLSGQKMGELHGHESFVYRLSALPSGELVSVAEDRTLRVWRGMECIQTVTHPAISVWAVAVCPETSDIATGTSDGVIRIFTRSSDRVAAADVIQQFDEAISSSSIPQQQMGDINKEKLPGPDFLTSKAGTKEGQVQMIRENNGSITAHTWSMSAQTWVNVGTVVDTAASSGRKTEYMGKMYDFVFDVAIEEGQPSLKLPHNLSENPYDTATKFINNNELSLNYLEQVAQFIVQNTKGASIGQTDNTAGGPDPLGTESRYRPGEGMPDLAKALPQREYLSITAAKYEPMFNKILSINSNLIAAGRKDISLNPSNQNALAAVRKALEANQAAPDDSSVDMIMMMCTEWDYADRLAALDLLRCVATSAAAANPPRNPIQAASQSVFDGISAGSQPNENLAMLAMRVIVNLFSSDTGRRALTQIENTKQVLGFVERVLGLDGNPALGKSNRNLQVALATALLNLTVMATKPSISDDLPAELRERVLVALNQVLSTQTDGEILYRALVGAGTLTTVMERGRVKAVLEKTVDMARDRTGDARCKDIAREISGLLQ